MNRVVRLFIASFIAAVLVSSTRAEEPKEENGDKAAAGRNLALQVCAACHVIGKEQKFQPILKPPAASFSVIMRRPALDEAFLREFLTSPHATLAQKRAMPNPRLATYQIDALVAYLLSLQKAR